MCLLYFSLLYFKKLIADVCTTCTKNHNRWRYATTKIADAPDEQEEETVNRYFNTEVENNDDVVVEKERREACSALQKDINAALIIEEEDTKVERNKIILDAALHVKEAQAMRDKVINKYKKLLKIINYHIMKPYVVLLATTDKIVDCLI